MGTAAHLAKHFRDVFFGGNWTAVNLRDSLDGLTWQEATKKVDSLNTIAVLVFHINYYISAILAVMQGEPLNAKDKFSFDLPALMSEEDWQALQADVFTRAEEFARRVDQIEDSRLATIFAAEKYGTWHRNLLGVIEHTHYHLGQIVILKKLVQQQQADSNIKM